MGLLTRWIQCEAFSADFAGRRSICALRRAKITEGERVVPPGVALHGRQVWHYTAGFCAQTLAGAVFQKGTWLGPGQLDTTDSEKEIRSMCAGFAAHRRPGLSNRECHWVAPV